MSVLSASLLLFFVLDPIGNMPLFVALLRGVPPHRRRRVLIRELVIAMAVLILFLFAGRHLLVLLDISEPSLGISGGIILFLIAIRLIFSEPHTVFGGAGDVEPFVFPLAVPSIAGPSAMATIIVLMARAPSQWPQWLLALGLAWAATGAILMVSEPIVRLVGNRALSALQRLMGMLLTMIAVELFLKGLTRVAFIRT